MFKKILKIFKKDKPLVKSTNELWVASDRSNDIEGSEVAYSENPDEINKYEKILDNLSMEEISKIENICKNNVKVTCIKNFKKKTSNFSNDFKGYINNRKSPAYTFMEGKTYEIDRSEKDVIYVSQYDNSTNGTSSNPNPAGVYMKASSNDRFSLVNGKPNYKYFFDYFMLESEWKALNRENNINSILE